ncbi:MAG: hypothetical protein PHO32_08055 [Candidatus Cloacimonetes bacterium]|nr:hypothetical protein [Candidatus Cloacimonadota bacterium]
MSKNEISPRCPIQISPVLEQANATGDGYFGFTCFFADGKFKNVLVNYDILNRQQALSQITSLYISYQESICFGVTQ